MRAATGHLNAKDDCCAFLAMVCVLAKLVSPMPTPVRANWPDQGPLEALRLHPASEFHRFGKTKPYIADIACSICTANFDRVSLLSTVTF